MTVLTHVGEEWRLFWVLELMGSSLGLALLVVKLTGNGYAIQEGNDCEWEWSTKGCSIYSWSFILHSQLVAVTAFALLVSRAVARPAFSLAVRVLRPPSRSWVFFSLTMLCLVAYFAWARSSYAQQWLYVAKSLAGLVLVCSGFALIVGFGYFCKLKTAYTAGAVRWRSVDRRRQHWLFWSGLAIFLAVFALELVLLAFHDLGEFTEVYSQYVYEPCREVLDVSAQVIYLFLDAWLVFGMELTDLFSPGFLLVDPSLTLPSLLASLLIAVGVYEGAWALLDWLFHESWDLLGISTYHPAFVCASNLAWLIWRLKVGKYLWGWTREVRAIAYWYAASRLIDNIVYSVTICIHAATEQVVT